MPLLKRGMAVKVVQLETLKDVGALKDVDVLLMTYEGMKPMKADYHDVLAAWVKGGGSLVMIDDFKDPYNAAKAYCGFSAGTNPANQAALRSLFFGPHCAVPVFPATSTVSRLA